MKRGRGQDRQTDSVEELAVGYVLTLYAAGTHILGIVIIRDS